MTVAEGSNLLTASNLNILTSGVKKMIEKEWIKEKDAKEFLKKIDEEFFSASDKSNRAVLQGRLALEMDYASAPGRASYEKPSELFRFISYDGKEQWVDLDTFLELRRRDNQEFQKEVGPVRTSNLQIEGLEEFLKTRHIPFDKGLCIQKGETWVQEQLFTLLKNEPDFNDCLRERHLGDRGRIDFDVNGIGLEVKIFRGPSDFDRLAKEILHYSELYDSILIPYINAGYYTDSQLLEELNLLARKHHEVRGFFMLKCEAS
jgi:hypothetical protein